MFSIITPEDRNELLQIIEAIKDTVTPEIDVIWAGYNSIEQLLEELDNFSERIKQGELDCLKDLSIEFAPTSSFQELSISNGWSAEYIELASKFDQIYERYK